jgi:nitrogen fixation/metabolism regulation signal transduction histidine kinase
VAHFLFDENPLVRAILDGIPSMVFVVDEDVRILDANQAAVAALGQQASLVLRQLCGEALRCLNAAPRSQGCGTTDACKECAIRQGAIEAAKTGSAYRRRHTMTMERSARLSEAHFIVTATPVVLDGQPRVIVVLDDVTEVVSLRRIVPMCANCKRIRDDREYWQRVETYLSAHTHLDFSHGVCPECERLLYPDLLPPNDGRGGGVGDR